MAFNQKEQEIIKWGLQNGKSKEEVATAISKYRANDIKSTLPTEQGGSLGQKAINSIKESAKSSFEYGKQGYEEARKAENIGELLGGSLKMAGGAIGTAFSPLAPVVKPIGDIIANPPEGSIAQKITESPAFQQFAVSPAGEATSAGAEAVQNLAAIAGTVAGVTEGAPKIATFKVKIPELKIPKGGTKAIAKVKEYTIPKSPEIMNRVARLKPTDATKFENLAGKSHGEYLTETGNFGTPDKIIANEATKFSKSIADKTAELAKLPGVYKTGSLNDALNMLLEKAKSESSANVKSPYLSEVQTLIKKHNNIGLSMLEAEKVKSLLEKNVKLGYNKITNGEKITQATNIDTALRNWQTKQATDLGFTNIRDLNKQTQLSKFIIDKLGDEVVGKTGLNNIGLSDWVILAGGDPTAVGAFLTKRFFGSKAVQAKVAEMLNKAQIKGQILPETKITPANIERQVSPTGAKQLPAGKSPTSEIKVPIELRGESTMEKGVPRISMSPQQPLSKIKSRKPSANNTIKKGIWQPKPVKIGNKTFKEILEADKKEMIGIIDYLRTGKAIQGIEKSLDRYSTKFNINTDLSNTKIADIFEKLVENTKTK